MMRLKTSDGETWRTNAKQIFTSATCTGVGTLAQKVAQVLNVQTSQLEHSAVILLVLELTAVPESVSAMVWPWAVLLAGSEDPDEAEI
ncbi:hypothetical protein TWF103_001866 [Orbilia oligospora]|nr:hypothetical protein TWF103_001866 [Orbilia oligospora]